MSVYFITAREVGRVKIGHTATSIRSRLSFLNVGSPVHLAIEAEMDGGREHERELHLRFARHRYRGEWFALCPEIEALITAHAIPEPPAPTKGTADCVVRKFGGASELARKLGVPMTTVASWRQKNAIPHWRRAAIKVLAEEQGFSLADQEFPG